MIKLEELIPNSGFQLENHLALVSLHKVWEVQPRMGDSPAENKLPRDQRRSKVRSKKGVSSSRGVSDLAASV